MAEPPEMIGFTEKLLDRGRQQHADLTERLFKQGSALSAWLVIGNAGALLFAAKALVDGRSCAPELIQFSALSFAIGLLLTVAGMMLGFLVTSVIVGKLSSILDEIQGEWIAEVHIEALEREEIEVPQDAPLRVSKARHEAAGASIFASSKRWGWWGVGLASALTLLGCIAFGVGVLRPLLTPDALAACASDRNGG